MTSVPEHWRQSVAYRAMAQELCVALGADNGDAPIETQARGFESEAAAEWVSNGCVRYRITHGLTALLAMTTSGGLDWSRLPHRCFLIEVPPDMLLMSRASNSDQTRFAAWIGVVCTSDTHGFLIALSAGKRYRVQVMSMGAGLSEEAQSAALAPLTVEIAGQVRVNRIVSNLVDYITEFPAQVHPNRGCRTPGQFDVRLPRDVVVSSTMIQAARSLGSAPNLSGVRRAMRHVVRGHWRNQPCGTGRAEIKRLWVRPHQRGDQSFGRVLEKQITVGLPR